MTSIANMSPKDLRAYIYQQYPVRNYIQSNHPQNGFLVDVAKDIKNEEVAMKYAIALVQLSNNEVVKTIMFGKQPDGKLLCNIDVEPLDITGKNGDIIYGVGQFLYEDSDMYGRPYSQEFVKRKYLRDLQYFAMALDKAINEIKLKYPVDTVVGSIIDQAYES